MASDPYAQIEREFASAESARVIDQLTEQQRATLRAYWLARADGELTTALSFEFMLDDLRELGAPGALTALAERAVHEEHQHSDWCVRWAKRLGAGELASARLLGTRALTFAGARSDEQRLLRTVFGSCFSETVAVHVLRASQLLIRIESVRVLNHQHMREELDHARLGWGLLAWEGITRREREMVRHYVPEITALTRATWMSSERTASDALHAFGYLSGPLVDQACEEALETVVMPGLERLGVL